MKAEGDVLRDVAAKVPARREQLYNISTRRILVRAFTFSVWREYSSFVVNIL